MAASWEKVFNMQGFDKDHHPKWQMVPVDGDRYMALRDGVGLAVSCTNLPVLTVTEIPVSTLPIHGERMPLHRTDRIFKLHGVTKGNAKVQAKQGALLQAELEVDTKNKKTVKVTFNFVRDSGGHHTLRAPASAAQWVKQMNYIYNGQANVFVTLRATRSVNVASDLGPQVMWDATPGSEWNTVTALGDGAADMNYFLVWEYEQDSTPTVDDTDAGTLGGNCIFEDHAGSQIGTTMAHEMGHFLGRPDHYDAARQIHLMHGVTDARGYHLPKEDVIVMNP